MTAQSTFPPSTRTYLVAGAFFLTLGILLVAWTAWSFLAPAAPPPYRYALAGEGGPGDFPDLGLDPARTPELDIRRFEIRSDGVDEPLAEAFVSYESTATGTRTRLIEWRNKMAEPVLHDLGPIEGARKLVAAVEKNLTADAHVLAWWDTSQRLGLLTDVGAPFDVHLNRPVLVPDPWRNRREAVEQAERGFWGGLPSAADSERFETFLDALLAPPDQGLAALRRLAGADGNGYLLLSLRDAFKAGVARPDAFGIGFKDFPRGTDLHGTIGNIKSWLRENGHAEYAMLPVGEAVARVYFLTDTTSRDTLLAHLLPFTSSNPMEVAGAHLVFQDNEYWVYRLEPEA